MKNLDLVPECLTHGPSEPLGSERATLGLGGRRGGPGGRLPEMAGQRVEPETEGGFAGILAGHACDHSHAHVPGHVDHWPHAFSSARESADGASSPGPSPSGGSAPRRTWTREEAAATYRAPFMDLLFWAQSVHRANFDPSKVQLSRLLSIKTGGCQEDCGYCSQSAHHAAGLTASKLMEVERVLFEARAARDGGATRYCMGAAWRSPKDRDMDVVVRMVEGVKSLGMEACMTLGMLTDRDVERLKAAGLDYYNHNIDTSERYYGEVITTRTFADRLETLDRVRMAGIKVCSGGIVGMGETEMDRVDMLVTLANLPEPPESVPINMLVAIPGTPLEAAPRIDPIDFVRTIALARIMMPTSFVRLSAGRTEMTDELQALCFFAGANSVFVGDKLLTTANPGEDRDEALFLKLGLVPMTLGASAPGATGCEASGSEECATDSTTR